MHIIVDKQTNKVVTPCPLTLKQVREELAHLTKMFPEKIFSVFYLFAEAI